MEKGGPSARELSKTRRPVVPAKAGTHFFNTGPPPSRGRLPSYSLGKSEHARGVVVAKDTVRIELVADLPKRFQARVRARDFADPDRKMLAPVQPCTEESDHAARQPAAPPVISLTRPRSLVGEN